MKKKIIGLLLCFTTVLCLTGCKKFKSYTFKVETGDKIKIKMETSDGYNLTSNLPIEFSKDSDVLSQGIFAKAETYDTYKNSLKFQYGVEILEEKETNNIEYLFYKYNNSIANITEYNYIIKIKNSNTCFILGNKLSKEKAKEIFNRLTISVE